MPIKSPEKTDNQDNCGIRMKGEVSPVLTVPEAAVFLRVSESVIRRLMKERRIPFFQIERRTLLYRPAVEKWIESLIQKPDGRPSGVIAKQRANEIIEEIGGKHKWQN